MRHCFYIDNEIIIGLYKKDLSNGKCVCVGDFFLIHGIYLHCDNKILYDCGFLKIPTLIQTNSNKYISTEYINKYSS